MDEYKFLASLVGEIGIPAIICLYTLFGVNKTLQKQDATLKQLTDAIKVLTVDVQKIEKLENQTRELSSKVEKLQADFSLKVAHMQWKGDSHDLPRH